MTGSASVSDIRTRQASARLIGTLAYLHQGDYGLQIVVEGESWDHGSAKSIAASQVCQGGGFSEA